jgi:AraC-like DNA-binding protein
MMEDYHSFFQRAMVILTWMMAKMTSIFRRVPLYPAPRVADLRVDRVGYMPAKQTWIDHRFDDPGIGFVVSGQGEYRVDNGPVREIRPGTQFAVYPGARFHYGPSGSAGQAPSWEEYYVIFQGAGVKRWEKAGWFFRDGSVHPLVDLGPIVERFRELIRVVERSGVGDADRAAVMTERLLLEMYYSRASVRESRHPTAAMEAVLGHCHEHFAEPIDFEILAERHAMSYSHLRQQMRKLTGVPPHQYVIRLRCEAARRMLSDTDLAIKEIAGKVGIEDPYTFSRTFKRCVGTSPGRYREQAAPWSRR